MKNKLNLMALASIILMSIFASSCIEEEPLVVTGSVAGVVTDADMGEPISGVIISLGEEGTKLTSSDGTYKYTDIPEGEYELVVSKTDYNSKTENVTITAGNNQSKDIVLQLTGASLEVSTSTLDFGSSSLSESIILQNTSGKGSMSYIISCSEDWLNVSSSNGTIVNNDEMIIVTIERTTLTTGNYSAILLITAGDGGSCTVTVKVSVEQIVKPTVRINNSEGIKKTEFSVNAEIVSMGTEEGLEYGFVWSTEGTPTIENFKKNLGVPLNVNAYSATITGLQPLTTYYVRAYARSAAGIAYSGDLVITTLDPNAKDPAVPSITIEQATNVTKDGADINFSISDVGEPSITNHGLCIGTTSEPTKENLISDYGTLSNPSDFNKTISGLSEGVTYYVRAYAENETGISYSNEIEFTTLSSYPKTVYNESYVINILSCKRTNTTIKIEYNVKNEGSYTTFFYGKTFEEYERPRLSTDDGDIILLSSSTFGSAYWGEGFNFASQQVMKGTWTFNNVPEKFNELNMLLFTTRADQDGVDTWWVDASHVINDLPIQN